MSEYDWSRFQVHMYFGADVETVYAAWATADGMNSFFSEQMQYTDSSGRARSATEHAHSGDGYAMRWHHGHELNGRVIAAESPHRFAFTFGEVMTVEVSLTAENGRTHLELVQEQIPIDEDDRARQHLNCRCCWVYYLTNLKAALEHGIDVRETNAETADCISVHYAQQMAAAAAR